MLDYLPAILAAIMFQQSGLTVNTANYTVTDAKNGHMWQYKAQEHGERDYATSWCNELDFANHSDWYLPNKAQSGYFHAQMNAQGDVPEQLFSRCTAEVVSDGYVATKKGAETYSFIDNPGDPINFSGGANIRCVRDL